MSDKEVDNQLWINPRHSKRVADEINECIRNGQHPAEVTDDSLVKATAEHYVDPGHVEDGVQFLPSAFVHPDTNKVTDLPPLPHEVQQSRLMGCNPLFLPLSVLTGIMNTIKR